MGQTGDVACCGLRMNLRRGSRRNLEQCGRPKGPRKKSDTAARQQARSRVKQCEFSTTAFSLLVLLRALKNRSHSQKTALKGLCLIELN